ncbi:LLM class flavin-dependent oxidoreductase [Kribbella turkmenica]|uniref:LLM class flavin-dependent oxidoreductase n=1 Tax=Kribbella turkmenica TaxID=2530375 RepID=UPI0014055B49|nr:LLM class flavin-dependent oxidoreductase [Kribbella turkmenica]
MELTNGIRVGIRLPNSGPFAGPREIFDLARHIEANGFDHVWVHDHISWTADRRGHFSTGAIDAQQAADPNFFESVTTAAAVGAVLERTQVGIAGLALPLRDPRILAKQLATIDALLGRRRLILAVGVGSQPADFDTMGVPFKRRGRITNDYLAALRQLLRFDGPLDVQSDALTFSSQPFWPRGDGVEIWVAARSGPGLTRAAILADGWLTAGMPVEEYAEATRHWHGALEAVGLAPQDRVAAYETFACIDESYDGAVELARPTLEAMYGDVQTGLSKALVGDPTAFSERLVELSGLGAEVFELRLLGTSMEQLMRQVEVLADAVLPKVRPLKAGT